MTITIIKTIHVVTALLSIFGFLLRGWWRLRNHPLVDWRCMKVIPHINDTVLLVSAIVLAILTGISPFQHDWLAAKIIALVVYILLGLSLMRFAKTQSSRIVLFLAAILSFAYIIAVATSKSVLPFIGA